MQLRPLTNEDISSLVPALRRADLPKPHGNQIFDKSVGQRLVGREVQRALGHGVPGQLVAEFVEDRAAVRQVAEVV